MKQRAGLARSLVLDPTVLLCDEPDSGLDPVRTSLLGELLQERHRELGGTVMVVTHNVTLARSICDHVSLLWKGRIVESGPAEEVFNSEDPIRAPVPRGPGRRPARRWTEPGPRPKQVNDRSPRGSAGDQRPMWCRFRQRYVRT